MAIKTIRKYEPSCRTYVLICALKVRVLINKLTNVNFEFSEVESETDRYLDNCNAHDFNEYVYHIMRTEAIFNTFYKLEVLYSGNMDYEKLLYRKTQDIYWYIKRFGR